MTGKTSSDPSCLIASLVDYEEALGRASEEQRKILEQGRGSSSVIDRIGAAVYCRQVLAEKMDKAELVRYVQHLQNRYRMAVNSATYARYEVGVPKKFLDKEKTLRAELMTLSYRLRLAYAVSWTRDTYLASIKWVCLIVLVASVLVCLFMLWAQWFFQSNTLINFTVVALLGLSGAVTSIARRADKIVDGSPLADDPVVQASALQEGNASLFVAGLTGPIFAMVLTLVFMGTGTTLKLAELTPTFVVASRWCSCLRQPDFQIFGASFYVSGPASAALLALWSFVAGFAEQFVPDVLDRFTKNTDK
jgi:hypothetical protein